MIMVSYSADCCEEWIAVDKAGHVLKYKSSQEQLQDFSLGGEGGGKFSDWEKLCLPPLALKMLLFYNKSATCPLLAHYSLIQSYVY